jgi:hypothetical protein
VAAGEHPPGRAAEVDSDHGYRSIDVTLEAVAEWGRHVADMYGLLLLGKVTSWFTGYNSNVEGREVRKIRKIRQVV